MILVTGASGLLGANLVMEARTRFDRIVAVYRQHPFGLPGIISVQADLTEARSIRRLLSTYRPRWIVHCAAMTDVDRCELHPEEAWSVNADLSRRLAAEARRAHCRVLYVSTDSVFDGRRGDYSEDDSPNPINSYARSKLAGEKEVLRELHSSLVVRTCIYGWNAQDKLSLAETILRTLEAGEVFRGYVDVVFTPILANDLAQLLFQMMERDLSGVFHAVGGQACSKFDFASQLADSFGFSRDLIQPASLDEKPLRAPRPRTLSLRTDRLREALELPRLPDVGTGLLQFKMLRDASYVSKLKSYCKEA